MNADGPLAKYLQTVSRQIDKARCLQDDLPLQRLALVASDAASAPASISQALLWCEGCGQLLPEFSQVVGDSV